MTVRIGVEQARSLFGVGGMALILLSCSCSRLRPPPSALDRLKPCPSSEAPTDAYCGKVEVWENRGAQSGRKLTLKIVLLPGLRREPAPDPIFFLAGGPGQGAAKMARQVRELFRNLQADRDIVLVDQRGTGASNALECKDDEDNLDQDPQITIEKLRACLSSYQANADVRYYTTTIAMDDLDDVRQFLGYSRINLYGGSYGTRAAIVYTRQHGNQVRSVSSTVWLRRTCASLSTWPVMASARWSFSSGIAIAIPPAASVFPRSVSG